MGTGRILAVVTVLGAVLHAGAQVSAYHDTVLPILAEHCYLCHGPDDQKGRLRLDSYAALSEGGRSGNPLVAGDADVSLLYQAVSGLHEDLQMPPQGEPLAPEKVAAIRDWINAGAEGPTRLSAGEVKSDHWGYLPIDEYAPPEVADEGWVRNPIDRFILRMLEDNGVAPAPEADKVTLLRRLHLDFTGLPPTPEEVDAFVSDTSADAYERVVDRLLASPHFGERWARHWLDLARYADSDGYEKDDVRPWAWRYRDWVIDALNSDKPYDEFVVEQLAGDLLPDATVEQKVATGFHRNTLTNREGGVDQEEFRVAQVLDRTNTTMQALMGVTMSCAQCHTHKYDPITHAEYFQVYALFNSADERDIRAPLRSEQEAYEAALAEYEQTLGALTAERDARLEDLAPKLDEWERGADTNPIEWVTLEPLAYTASSGAQLQKLGDGSILVQGSVADKDTYTIELESDLENITAFQLEALLDGSLPETGPGRADNGNFVVSNFRVAALPEGRPRVINLAAFATPSSPEEPRDDGGSTGERAAVDGDENTFWDKEDYRDEYRLKLDFRGRKRVGAITITGYAHHDFAPKDFKILLDGEVVHEVADAEYDNNFFITEFPQQRCGSLELVITGYYGGSPAIRELGVYEHDAETVLAHLRGPEPLGIETALADHEQRDLGAVGALDGNSDSGWATGGNSGTARFVVASPQSNGKTRYTFTINQQYGGKHTLGRFRLSATRDSADKVLLSERARQVLLKPDDERSDEERHALLLAYGQIDGAVRGLYAQIAAHQRTLPSVPPTMAQTLAERGEKRETHIQLRGDFLQLGDKVEPGTPAVFTALQPRGNEPDRLDLAHWLVAPDNPLTARVQVNRVWSHLFGTGLVRTPEDFGVRGERPTHPQLLDWLAQTYMGDLGWSTKGLIRMIATSSAYRQSSRVRPELLETDPANRLIARQGRFRLEAEIVRDVFFAASGLLNTDRIGGPSMRPYLPESVANLGYANSVKYPVSPVEEQRRRGLYIHFQRTIALPMLMTFDCPDSNVTTLKRERSGTPLQALTLLNDPVFVECAQGLGSRILDELAEDGPRERLRHAFRLCMSREPSEAELARLLEGFEAYREIYGVNPEEAARMGRIGNGELPLEETAAYAALARAIMNLGEFIMRE